MRKSEIKRFFLWNLVKNLSGVLYLAGFTLLVFGRIASGLMIILLAIIMALAGFIGTTIYSYRMWRNDEFVGRNG